MSNVNTALEYKAVICRGQGIFITLLQLIRGMKFNEASLGT